MTEEVKKPALAIRASAIYNILNEWLDEMLDEGKLVEQAGHRITRGDVGGLNMRIVAEIEAANPHLALFYSGGKLFLEKKGE